MSIPLLFSHAKFRLAIILSQIMYIIIKILNSDILFFP